MCGIAGASGKGAEDLVRKMLEVIRQRGPDGSGIFSAGDIALGNVLLKITGEKNQPISNSSALTYNGEIYNFKNIATELDIATNSDSETLFALLSSKGIEAAVAELDGDYAFAYYDREKLYLVRDPAGVKPLFYGTGEIFAFASEKKALYAIGIQDVQALAPGGMLTWSSGKIFEKKVGFFRQGERIKDEKTVALALFEAIEDAVKKRCCKQCAIAFSGGIDSSLIAALYNPVGLYSAGMAGSHDLHQTLKAAKSLGLSDKLHFHELTSDEVEAALPAVMRAIESSDPMKVSIAMPLYIASKDAHIDGIRVMLSGQGADELFAGYRRYESMNPEELTIELEKDLGNIASNNLERDDAVTMANSVELRVPYLDRKVIELSLRIAPELKIHNGIRKYILRMAAMNTLPEEIVRKEKKAAQYSSGIFQAMKKLARKNGYGGEVGRYLEGVMQGVSHLDVNPY